MSLSQDRKACLSFAHDGVSEPGAQESGADTTLLRHSQPGHRNQSRECCAHLLVISKYFAFPRNLLTTLQGAWRCDLRSMNGHDQRMPSQGRRSLVLCVGILSIALSLAGLVTYAVVQVLSS